MMKRIKHEQIQSSLSHYLKRRAYISPEASETSHKRDRRTQHVDEMALQKTIQQLSDTENVVAFSSISADATTYDQQFNRLKQTVQESGDQMRNELHHVLFPVFIHIYLQLLCNGHKAAGYKFYSRHRGLFTEEQGLGVNLLDNLSKLQTRSDVLGFKEATDFREHRYSVSLTDESLQYLNKFLKSDDNMVMFQIFNTHIKLKVITDMNMTLELHEERRGDALAPASPPMTPENKVIHDEVTLSALQKSIKQVHDGPPCIPSICLYTVHNAYQGLCTATLSPHGKYLSGGFEDSSIRLWHVSSGEFDQSASDALYGASKIWLADGCVMSDDAEEEEQAEQKPGKYFTEDDDIENRKYSKMESGDVHVKSEVDDDDDDVNYGDTNTDIHHTQDQESHIDRHDGESVTLRGHSGAVYQTVFMSDATHLLSCSADMTVRLWDLETYSNVVCYRGHNYPVWDIDVSSVGGYFASCSQDHTAKLWRTDRIYPLRTFVGHTQDVDCIKFHPNCSYLATGSCDKTVRLWSLQDGKCVRLMQGHRSGVMTLAFSPNGHYLASAAMPHPFLAKLHPYLTYVGIEQFLNSLTINFKKTTGEDRKVKVWDLGSGVLVKDLRGHTDMIHTLCFSADNSMLASGGLDCAIRIWDMRKGAHNNTTDYHSSAELLGTFSTTSANIHHLRFAQYNLLQAVGSS